MPVRTHEHLKCPRCNVLIGRYDTICWACRHVLRAPGRPIKYVWVGRSILAIVGVLAVILMIKYRTQMQFMLVDAVRSLIKPH